MTTIWMMTGINLLILTAKGQNLLLILFVPLLFMIDFYCFEGIRGLSPKWKFTGKKTFRIIYWFCSVSLLLGMLFSTYSAANFGIRFILLVPFFFVLLLKTCFAPFIIADDLRRIILHNRKEKNAQTLANRQEEQQPNIIPRSEFLIKAGLLAGSIPMAGLWLNMKSGLYDYQIKRQTLYLPNLPKTFDGMKLGQFSDLHAGNLKNIPAVKHGVEMLMREKADIVFFTGDLVDALSSEIHPFINIFNRVKAPLGVYSSLGNHDYGDYSDWDTPAQKRKNFENILSAHKNMGWDLLRNENRRVKVGGEEIGILGVENWGAISRLPKYGRIDLAVKNTDDLPVKLLLSHDPSHWRAQILPHYPQIDVMFSGHTHGMQFGVRTNDFQWSPIEYIYKEWAGLYQEGAQQLYVNVGYGFLAVEGRVGILPEITIFELKCGANPLLTKV